MHKRKKLCVKLNSLECSFAVDVAVETNFFSRKQKKKQLSFSPKKKKQSKKNYEEQKEQINTAQANSQ